MNYFAGILVLALAGAITSAAVFRGNAAEWQMKYTALQASYSQAANKARSDAQAQEQKDTAQIQQEASQAILDAANHAEEAQNQLRSYKAKLAAAAMEKDLGHRCAGVEIPKDLIP